MFKKAFDLFLFTSLFIAVCAVVMTVHTFGIFRHPVEKNLLYFIFFGSVCSYNFHWYLTPAGVPATTKNKWTLSNKRVHALFYFIGLMGAIYFAYTLWHFRGWLAVTVVITFLYSAPKLPFKPFILLRKIAIAKTSFLAFAWTHITAILPILYTATPWKASHYLFVLHRFFFIYALCILFDYRDREEDRKEGIKSMITDLNETGIHFLFWSTLAVSVLFAIAFFFTSYSITTLLILIIPSFILGLLYAYAKKSSSDYLYYFVLDGLMMLSGLLQLVIHF